MELVLSLNELDPARELRDPDVELAGKGINFFAIKTPRKKKGVRAKSVAETQAISFLFFYLRLLMPRNKNALQEHDSFKQNQSNDSKDGYRYKHQRGIHVLL